MDFLTTLGQRDGNEKQPNIHGTNDQLCRVKDSKGTMGGGKVVLGLLLQQPFLYFECLFVEIYHNFGGLGSEKRVQTLGTILYTTRARRKKDLKKYTFTSYALGLVTILAAFLSTADAKYSLKYS